MLRDVIRKKFMLPLAAGAILGLAALGCDQAGDRQSRENRGLEQDRSPGTAKSPAERAGQERSTAAPGDSSAERAGQASSAGESVKGTVVKVDKDKNEIVVNTDQGEKSFQIASNTQGVEKLTEGAQVTVRYKEADGKLQAEEIIVSMARPESTTS